MKAFKGANENAGTFRQLLELLGHELTIFIDSSLDRYISPCWSHPGRLFIGAQFVLRNLEDQMPEFRIPAMPADHSKHALVRVHALGFQRVEIGKQPLLDRSRPRLRRADVNDRFHFFSSRNKLARDTRLGTARLLSIG